MLLSAVFNRRSLLLRPAILQHPRKPLELTILDRLWTMICLIGTMAFLPHRRLHSLLYIPLARCHHPSVSSHIRSHPNSALALTPLHRLTPTCHGLLNSLLLFQVSSPILRGRLKVYLWKTTKICLQLATARNLRMMQTCKRVTRVVSESSSAMSVSM